MDGKIIEIRDSATCLIVVAFRTYTFNNSVENWGFRREGFGPDSVYLVRLNDQQCAYDPFKWANSRTMFQAHLYLQDHYDELESGDVLDIEYILGEKTIKKVSERISF